MQLAVIIQISKACAMINLTIAINPVNTMTNRSTMNSAVSICNSLLLLVFTSCRCGRVNCRMNSTTWGTATICDSRRPPRRNLWIILRIPLCLLTITMWDCWFFLRCQVIVIVWPFPCTLTCCFSCVYLGVGQNLNDSNHLQRRGCAACPSCN